ncbi:major tail protein, partial [Paraclostridium sordellii]|uniref:major tail protein n=1 Tax=Paraclostridium sordellii TaxID=1505 RepID=UPI00038681BE
DESITFDTPRYLEGIKQIGIKPKQNSDPYYHEGRKVLEEQTLQDVKVTLNITDLSDADECYVMGHKLAKTGGVIKNDNDIAPTLAILYKAEKSQGIDKYGILFAGTFV